MGIPSGNGRESVMKNTEVTKNLDLVGYTWSDLAEGLSRPKPSTYILELRETGRLAEILPEVDKLFGIPQRAEHHPEIDTGIHTMMVVDRAAQLTDNIDVRFAALTHDLGKGLTDPANWPKHFRHEDLGVKPIGNIAARLGIPEETTELAVNVAKYHLHAHRAFEQKAGTLVKLFERTNAFNKPERFELFVLAVQADAQGRLYHENKPYPQAQLLTEALAQASAIQTDGLSRERIAQDRVRRIGSLMKELALNP